MATTDYTVMRSPCLCGQGQIVVTQEMPDHPWVRASQISYSGALECAHCSKTYTVINDWGSKPYVAKLSDVAKFELAKEANAKADAEFKNSAQAQALIPKIVAEIDGQPSKAARHRLLSRFGLTRDSYATYLKCSQSGAEAVKYITGHDIAHIGGELGLAGGQAQAFATKAKELEALQKASWERPPAIVTGATWMQR